MHMPVELLDYTKADIRIMVETQWERQWRSKSAAKEPETTAWINEYVQNDYLFWDIGANVGTYGLMAASRGDLQVWCFEPETANYHRLLQNIGLNPELKVACAQVAFSDKTGDGFLNVPHGGKAGAANNHLSDEGQEVEVYRMDDWRRIGVHDQPDHVKIDVDGHELQVVRGGVETLQACKTVMIEIEHEDEGLEEIRAVFAGFGETMFYRSGTAYNHRFVRSTDG